MNDMFPDDLLSKLADKLGENLRMGQGKKAHIIEDLRKSLYKPCPYCKTPLSPSNVVYDHKAAIGSELIRKTVKAKNRTFDNWDNLHLTCTPCNRFKSNLNHDEFIGFLEYLSKFPAAKAKFAERFRKERTFYQLKRKKGFR